MRQLFLTCTIVSTTILGLFAAGHDFRQITWGMNASEVIDREGKPVARTHNGDFTSLVFNKKVAGLPAKTSFYLLNKAVGKGEYVFKLNHTNPNYFIFDFNKLKKILVKKYGAAKENDPMVWSDSTYKDNPDKFGLAVAKGHLRYVAHWENQTTKIELILKGENLKPKLRLTYTGKKYEKQVEKLMDDKSTEGL